MSDMDTYLLRDFSQGLCNPSDDKCSEGTKCFPAEEVSPHLEKDGIKFDKSLNYGIISFDYF